METYCESVVVLGPPGEQGTYLLQIELTRALCLRLGRRRSLRRFPAGHYVYLGSALGRHATSLPRRVLRHTTRKASRRPHALRAALLLALEEAGMASGLTPPAAKKLHWHIDYLLEPVTVQLRGCALLRSPRHLERELAAWVAADPEACIVCPGFGAGDAPGQTHLFLVPGVPAWWTRLHDHAASLLG